MKTNQIARNLRMIIDGSNENMMKRTLTAIVFNSLKHKQAKNALIHDAINSKAPTAFRNALKKFVALKLNEEKNGLTHCNVKQAKLIEELKLVGEFTASDVDGALPDIFFKATDEEKKASEANKLANINTKFKATNFTAKESKIEHLNALSINQELEAVEAYMKKLRVAKQLKQREALETKNAPTSKQLKAEKLEAVS